MTDDSDDDFGDDHDAHSHDHDDDHHCNGDPEHEAAHDRSAKSRNNPLDEIIEDDLGDADDKSQRKKKPHAHTEACSHDEVKRVPAPTLNSWSERWGEFKNNVHSRFVKSIDPTHVIDDGHGNIRPFKFETRHKAGAVLGAVASVGAIIHGGRNIMRGVTGYEDSRKEKHDPSALTTAVGAGEVVGGAAFLLRSLSGRYRI